MGKRKPVEDTQKAAPSLIHFDASEVIPVCDHCWHTLPTSGYSTWGYTGEEVCCHCGTRRNLHGPYAPKPYSGFQVQTRTLDEQRIL